VLPVRAEGVRQEDGSVLLEGAAAHPVAQQRWERHCNNVTVHAQLYRDSTDREEEKRQKQRTAAVSGRVFDGGDLSHQIGPMLIACMERVREVVPEAL
jgi:hypothetical protein